MAGWPAASAADQLGPPVAIRRTGSVSRTTPVAQTKRCNTLARARLRSVEAPARRRSGKPPASRTTSFCLQGEKESDGGCRHGEWQASADPCGRPRVRASQAAPRAPHPEGEPAPGHVGAGRAEREPGGLRPPSGKVSEVQRAHQRERRSADPRPAAERWLSADECAGCTGIGQGRRCYRALPLVVPDGDMGVGAIPMVDRNEGDRRAGARTGVREDPRRGPRRWRRARSSAVLAPINVSIIAGWLPLNATLARSGTPTEMAKLKNAPVNANTKASWHDPGAGNGVQIAPAHQPLPAGPGAEDVLEADAGALAVPTPRRPALRCPGCRSRSRPQGFGRCSRT